MPKAVDGAGWKMGPAVAINPKHIPEGCSDFEVIIGESNRARHSGFINAVFFELVRKSPISISNWET